MFSNILLLTLLAATLTACAQLNLPNPWASPTPPPTAPPVLTPTPENGLTPTPLPPQGDQVLTLWLPPAFDPALATPAGLLLEERIRQFQFENPGVTINIRIKALEGPSSLLNALSATAPAAPASVPAVIALPRNDMEAAALKGLIYPLEDYSQLLSSPDWYEYARQLSSVQESQFCLPFAGDALAMLYRPLVTGTPAQNWDELLVRGQPAVFAAGDTQALFTLALYVSAGGVLQDNQQRPILQAEALEKVLTIYQRGLISGYFPTWLPAITDHAQAWQAYSEQRVPIAFTWSSYYLGNLPADTNITSLPGLAETPVSMATGWSWCISELDPARRALAVRLAEYLVDPEFSGQWTAAAGYLPTRPTALASWSNQSLRSTINQIVLSAQVEPDNDQLYTLGPILENAATQVLQQQADPSSAARDAVQIFE